MIQQLSTKYSKLTASVLLTICYSGMILLPAYATAKVSAKGRVSFEHDATKSIKADGIIDARLPFSGDRPFPVEIAAKAIVPKNNIGSKDAPDKLNIGGPSQPEMSAFKSVGTDNMVNLFTGDFSYNIPLLDVGGYPVNIFYDGGVGMEQEASWVGLGWNINPGNVNRNMRGIPDDFNGEEKLIQSQNIKPNKTWGVSLGADVEVVGIKDLGLDIFSGSLGASLGVSVNNYLGPALELGLKGNTSLKVAELSKTEKSATSLSLGGGLSINASSRNGVTFSPSLSLTAKSQSEDRKQSSGFGLRMGTNYNSRTGVKALQISEQASFNKAAEKNNEVVRDAEHHSVGANIFSTSISFNKPSYIPALRMPLTNTAFSGHFQLGLGIFGVEGSEEVEIYGQKSRIAMNDQVQKKPMVGYLYLQNAKGNADAVMDLTRVNDNEVTPSTPIISAPQYAYDVFSIQGEGTGGSIRAYRNDEGYMRDNYTRSQDENTSVGVDIGVPGQYGANFNTISTPTSIGDWNEGNKLRSAIGFKEAANNWENVYFRNPGENSVLQDDQYKRIGDGDLVRYALKGGPISPTVEPELQKFSKEGKSTGTVSVITPGNTTGDRKKRTQVINFLNAKEASEIGLDKVIKSYDGSVVLDANKNLRYKTIPRYGDYRKSNHISEIDVLESSGQRYVYGIPVYNLVQKDLSFTVANGETDVDKVTFISNEASVSNSPHISPSAFKDGYVQTTETPAYAHSFLLSGLLSPDYVDVGNDGITDDDLGNAVKFNYTRIEDGNGWAVSRWRTPLTNEMKANFNAGKRTEVKDDKAVVSYGERESWYVHSIESKTMIAIFKLEARNDSKGANSELGGINSADNSAKRLKQIDLYSKADLKKNGLEAARPIKTVHFEYSYTLCRNTPNNTTSGEGKLTLEKIYFTFNGQNKASRNQYVFSYGTTAADNPQYAFNASDRWGTYKPSSLNPASAFYTGNLKNSDHPYTVQSNFPGINTQAEIDKKSTLDADAGAWMLKKILLPSGGQMEINYESDDYAFVQDRRAAVMMNVIGFGATATSTPVNELYTVAGVGIRENNVVFIKVPEACNSKQMVYKRYLEGIGQLSFKLAVKMPKGIEYINSYATISGDNYGVYQGDNTNSTIWIKLNMVDGRSPLSLTAIEFLREQLPGQAYEGYDVSESAGLEQIGDMLKGLIDGLSGAFKDPVNFLRQQGKAQLVEPGNCFVRLDDPDGFKYGGGYRVRTVKLKDNWRKMNQDKLYTSEYGQEYDYTTKEVFNGVERTISSGVASYEPSLGGDENPFQTMVQVSNKVPLGPASYGAIEMPVLDAFFPSPSVGYSKVTVRSIKKGQQDPTKKPRSGIGRQVTQFYTAKDYPVYYSNTSFDPGSDKQIGTGSLAAFFYKYAFDSRALSQGFLVETNDMHGKLRSQTSYPENDDKTPINYTENFYRNTGAKGFDDKFDFIYASQGGKVLPGNMGIDVELMTDLRQFTVKSKSVEVQGQLDLFPIFLPIWLPFIWPVFGTTENTYRAVTSTKVISYHSILDSVLVIDKGSQVSTKNLVYDSETGDVIVNRTNNEFKAPIYNTNYPAWWAYSGMGLAYKNINAIYKNMNFYDGVLSGIVNSDFESGDELYIIDPGTPPPSGCGSQLASSANIKKLWVFDKDKNTNSLTNTAPKYIFIDEQGKPYTRNGVSFKIVRSGHRNLLGQKAASIVTMGDPLLKVRFPSQYKMLKIDESSKVISASAMVHKEKWQTDADLIKTITTTYNPANCSYTDVEDCNSSTLEKNINPYLKGLLGNFIASQSRVFYGSRKETDPVAMTDLPQNGFLDEFKLYWDFNTNNNLVPDPNSTKWVWNSMMTRLNAKGLQLETLDALGIYTAAEYGFNKTMPVAIANNSRYNEMFAEGFEDNGYSETLTGASINPCSKKHIDFGSNIVPLLAGAHTGRNVIQVNANAQYVRTLNVGSPIDNAFDLKFGSGAVLTEQGPSFTWKKLDNLAVPPDQPDPNRVIIGPYGTGTGVNMKYSIPLTTGHKGPYLETGPSHSSFRAFFVTEQYVKVPIGATYNFSLHADQRYQYQHTGEQIDPPATMNRAAITLSIKKITGEWITSLNVYSDQNPNQPSTSNNVTFPVVLPCGDYMIETYLSSDITVPYEVGPQPFPPYRPSFWNFMSEASYSCNPPLYSYKPGCTITKPIPATVGMLNPGFTIQPGKDMLFSAWVREDCPEPCRKTDYTKSNIELWSGGTNLGLNSIKRVGPIIEGWQKIEGGFKVPVGATAAEIRFINSNNAPMYVDDIRIHPFNANMKSYVYDPVNLRLKAELDANNYASFYEYDEEGTLIRTKVETKEGIKTLNETRSAKQTSITAIE